MSVKLQNSLNHTNKRNIFQDGKYNSYEYSNRSFLSYHSMLQKQNNQR